jgi:hypothetical protein
MTGALAVAGDLEPLAGLAAVARLILLLLVSTHRCAAMDNQKY